MNAKKFTTAIALTNTWNSLHSTLLAPGARPNRSWVLCFVFALSLAPAGETCLKSAPLQYNGIYLSGRLIYDPNTDLTWYQPPYSAVHWDVAMTWAANLNIGGVTGWQLPSIAPLTPEDVDAGTSYSDDGQLGYLWYVVLGNEANDMINYGPFDPTQFYPVPYGESNGAWTSGGPYYAHLSTYATYFCLNDGEYGLGVTGAAGALASEIAVVSGDVGPNGPLGPLLTASLAGNNIIVSWPSPSTGWALQQCSNLAAGNWSPCGYTVADNGTNCSVTISLPPGNAFFRLAK